MLGFQVAQATDVLYWTIKEYYTEARIKLIEELQSEGYKDIIEDVFISDDFQEIEITLKEGYITERQDVIELFAQGGTLLKVRPGEEPEAVAIKPSIVLRKYLGKR